MKSCKNEKYLLSLLVDKTLRLSQLLVSIPFQSPIVTIEYHEGGHQYRGHQAKPQSDTSSKGARTVTVLTMNDGQYGREDEGAS